MVTFLERTVFACVLGKRPLGYGQSVDGYKHFIRLFSTIFDVVPAHVALYLHNPQALWKR